MPEAVVRWTPQWVVGLLGALGYGRGPGRSEVSPEAEGSVADDSERKVQVPTCSVSTTSSRRRSSARSVFRKTRRPNERQKRIQQEQKLELQRHLKQQQEEVQHQKRIQQEQENLGMSRFLVFQSLQI
jgi:hypothetical protein